jgi:phospholipase C
LAFYTADPFSIPDKHNQPHPTFADAHWTAYRFPDEIERDVDRQQLGAISIVLFPPPYDESAADGPAAKGIDRVTGVIDRLLADGSPYRETTLIIVAFLTSGGYYDHVPPPPAFPENGPVSPVLYGPRLPFLVTGYFAKTNYVSHVPIELSSISAFGEWNWLGGVGQLHGRDERIAPIGDLIDSDRSHAIVPSAPPDGGGGP